MPVGSYRLGDIVDYHSAVGIPVVHGGERLVSFLACSIPYLELHRCRFIEGDSLGEESGADGRLPVVIELILDKAQY